MDNETEMKGDMLHLDVSSKQRAKEFKNCKPGEKIVFEVECTVEKNTDGKLVAKVDDIVEYEKMDEDESEPEAEESEASKKMPKALTEAVARKNAY